MLDSNFDPVDALFSQHTSVSPAEDWRNTSGVRQRSHNKIKDKNKNIER